MPCVVEQRLWTNITRSRPSLGLRTLDPIPRSRHCFQSYARQAVKVKDPVPRRESGSISSYSQPASELNHDVGKDEVEHYDRLVAESKEKQIRTPWHRDGSDEPPVKRQRSAGAMTKGIFSK